MFGYLESSMNSELGQILMKMYYGILHECFYLISGLLNSTNDELTFSSYIQDPVIIELIAKGLQKHKSWKDLTEPLLMNVGRLLDFGLHSNVQFKEDVLSMSQYVSYDIKAKVIEHGIQNLENELQNEHADSFDKVMQYIKVAQ